MIVADQMTNSRRTFRPVLATVTMALMLLGSSALIATAKDSAAPQAASTIYVPMVIDGYIPTETSFGVQLYAKSPGIIEAVDQAGASWVRLFLTWSDIEPENTTPENYSWPVQLDATLADLGARDINIILVQGDPSLGRQRQSLGNVQRTR